VEAVLADDSGDDSTAASPFTASPFPSCASADLSLEAPAVTLQLPSQLLSLSAARQASFDSVLWGPSAWDILPDGDAVFPCGFA
jgi:hypothetical protein